MARILIVDDSPVIRKVIGNALKGATHEIVGAGKNGIEGLDLYKSTHPDLVLLDVTMPNRSGKECLMDIMAFDASAKVVMFSSVSDKKLMDECLKMGAKTFLNKEVDFMNPLAVANLISQLNKVLEAK